jgi:hypothetical protein
MLFNILSYLSNVIQYSVTSLKCYSIFWHISQILFNILKCGMTPEYLRHLVPPTIQSTTIYPLRNGDNLIVPFCRLSIWVNLLQATLEIITEHDRLKPSLR